MVDLPVVQLSSSAFFINLLISLHTPKTSGDIPLQLFILRFNL
jgi:hypothetical protein